MWKLLFSKIHYFINKYLYFFLNLRIIKIFIKIFYYLSEYFLILKNKAEDDIFTFRTKIDNFKNIYFRFNIFKHILFFFFLITGIIPLLLFIYLFFFFFKYFFIYIFLTLDYFFPFFLRMNLYIKIKNVIKYFFLIIPNSLLKIYRYFFGGGWLNFFFKKFINFLKKRWWKFLSYFFTVTDEILLVKSPKLYYGLKEKIIDFYYWLIRLFFSLVEKFKNFLRFFRFFKKIFRKVTRRTRKKYRLASRIYDRWFRKYYYLWYYWYIRSYIYYAWIFRKYIWSDAFVVTLEAFFFISFWNFVACIKYSIALVYTRLQYILCGIIYNRWVKFIYLEFSLDNFLAYLTYKFKELVCYLKFISLEFRRSFVFHFSSIGGQIIYMSPYAWYWWRHECYEVDKGYISLIWYSLKFYAIIQRFFRRLHPLPLRLFLFNRKIENLGFVITYEYLIRILTRRFIEGCYFMFYLKFIYFI